MAFLKIQMRVQLTSVQGWESEAQCAIQNAWRA